MKKALSLLLALLTASSISAMAFAADDVMVVDEPYGDDYGVNIAPRISYDLTDDETVSNWTIQPGELYLVDEDNYLVGVGNILTPDTEYTFRIHLADTDTPLSGTVTSAGNFATRELTGADLKTGTTYANVRLRTLKGSSSISSAKIEKRGTGDAATFRMVVRTRNITGTKLNDVQYRLDATSTALTDPINPSTHDFRVGYRTIPDDMTDVGEDGVITIDNDAPVITKKQFDEIAKSANYRNVWIEAGDGGWRYHGRVSGMPDTNFAYTYDAVPSVINVLDEHDFKFLTFRNGVSFPTNGEMRIEVGDIVGEFDNIYTYLYRNGGLTLINTTFDPGNEEIVFRTNYLGSFLMTDRPITNTNLLSPEETEDNENEMDNENENNNNNNDNPITGVNAGASTAIALAMTALAAAGYISRKK